jgi:GH24 family phage-related lysozyme (muramidase)
MNDYSIHPAIPLIKKFEGFKSSPYWDVNHYRVGYGSDTHTRPDGSVAEVRPGMSVSEEDAHRDLVRRVGESQNTIKSQIGDGAWNKLGPNGQAALTSVHYNYGHLPWGVQNAASSGDPAKTASAIAGLSGDNNGVNALRRQTEANTTLGLGETASGRFGLNGPQGTTPSLNRPNASASIPNSESGSSDDLLSKLLNNRGSLNPVPAYVPKDGKTFANSPIEGIIRSIGGQGTYTPPIVAKLQGIGGALNSAFGGSNQPSQGSAPAPGEAVSANASPADTAPPSSPPASAGNASAGGDTSNAPDVPLPPPRPTDLGNEQANAGGFLDSLKGLFGGNA